MDSRDAMCGSREQAGWTKERPTEPGYYWTRLIQDNLFPAGIVEVYKSGGCLCVLVMGDDWDTTLDTVHAEWHGPILPPPD